MKEKEAKELINYSGPTPPFKYSQILKGEGYLEAIEKAKGLEETLIDISKRHWAREYLIPSETLAKDTLAKWEKKK